MQHNDLIGGPVDFSVPPATIDYLPVPLLENKLELQGTAIVIMIHHKLFIKMIHILDNNGQTCKFLRKFQIKINEQNYKYRKQQATKPGTSLPETEAVC